MRGLLWCLAQVTAAFRPLPPWGRAAVVLAGIAALIRARMKPGAAFFVGAVALALAFDQDLEPFANALNQGVTGVPTVRLFLSLAALAWMAEILREGGAAARIRASGSSPVLASAMEGLLPGERPAGWFPSLARMALPVGAGFVVACQLRDPALPAARASALLLPLALAMAAVGLWLRSRSGEPPAPPAEGKGGLPEALIPVLLLLVLAFSLPEPRIPQVRSAGTLLRLAEGIGGLLTPVALGAVAGGLAAARLLGVGLPACRAALRRAFSLDLAAFAVGLRLLAQVAQAHIPYASETHAAEHAAAAAAASLRASLPAVLGSLGGLSALALLLPGVLGYSMRGAAEGFAASLPFLLPLTETGEGEARLMALAFAGACLGEILEKEGQRAAVPALLTALLAGLLALAP